MRYDPALAIPVLERTPGVLRRFEDCLPPGPRPAKAPERWSPYDVVGHLIHGERTDWIPRAEMILRVGEAEPFPPFDRVAMFRESAGKSLGELLDLFARLRSESVARLRAMALTPGDLERRGRHPELGTRHPGAAPRHLGGARPESRPADRPDDGARVRRGGGAVDRVPAHAPARGGRSVSPARWSAWRQSCWRCWCSVWCCGRGASRSARYSRWCPYPARLGRLGGGLRRAAGARSAAAAAARVPAGPPWKGATARPNC